MREAVFFLVKHLETMRYFWIGVALFLGMEWGAAAADNPPEAILIRYGDVVVTQADYQAELATVPERYRAGLKANSKRILQLLDKIFVYRILAQEARALGLDKDPQLRRQVELVVEEALGRARLEYLREQALATHPDFETLARERYRANQDKYRLPERVKASHILIKPSGRSEEETRQLAEKVRTLALAGKQSFSDLALKYSDDPSAEQDKGNLGFISRGRTVKPFEEAAFALQKPGEISPIVKTHFGYHIIRLEERRPGRLQSFKEVKEELIQEVKDTYLNKVVQAHLHKIRNADGIKMNREALQNLEKDLPKENTEKTIPSGED